ncbi:tyrosine-type recombinase/integrase [Bacillus anthracis]|uniref:Tyr recombinase domain-containing protein n=1 Tax=Bacillus anthracis TaxID=1392 RepID=A0A0J1HJZ3_BACAN|nr:tyrosine-type recombinase/integrase [Bacillus anthracis]KLV14087.1 hypothetical protein ABW01_28920 [Bacillus anthracis]
MATKQKKKKKQKTVNQETKPKEKKTKKQKEKEKRKARFKLSPSKIKEYGLENDPDQVREVEKLRKWVIKIHTVGKESNITTYEGENLGDGTREDYLAKSLKVMTDVAVKTKKNIFSITAEEVSHHLHETYGNNFSVNGYIHALGYTQNVIKQDNTIFRDKPTLMVRTEDDKTWSVKSDHDDRDWLRKASDSKRKKANYDEIQRLKEEVAKSKYSKAHKEQALKMIDLCAALGLRISEAISMTYGDILEKGNALHTQGKGGHHRYNQYSLDVHDDKAKEMLHELYNSKENTSPHKRIFEFRTEVKRDKEGNYVSGGQIMKDKAIQERIGKIINTCATRAGLNNVDQKVSMHSLRKYFAQSRVDHYKKYSVEQLRQEVQNRIDDNKRLRAEEKERVRSEKLAGKTKEQIKERKYPNLEKKFQTLKDRINYVELPSKKKPEGVKRTRDWREPELKELIFYLVSMDIGHQRVKSAPLHGNVYRIILLNGETLVHKTTYRAKFHEILMDKSLTTIPHGSRTQARSKSRTS